ncbi:LysR family transcriptional regulator substrate-binding protein [Verminephrobacter aporrectodeae]|uniref:LysR family transcriptional regulator substrate-binding protein n=1 Tax=Verminephrobacter aporrectodeae TaxID=1110389 RepID=UPI00223871E0|nr:LysR family transcriptional regulator substrate-binding protein [Verminephrobacter aporrectodeae]
MLDLRGGAVLARWLTGLHQQHTPIQIDLRSGLDELTLHELLRADAADIALTSEAEAERWVEHHRWTDTYRLVVTSQEERTTASVAQALGADPYLAFPHSGDHLLRAHLQGLGIDVRVAARIDHIDVLLSLVTQGGGCAIVPTSMLPAQLGGLRALHRLPTVLRRISLLARPRSLQSAAVRQIVDALATCAF